MELIDSSPPPVANMGHIPRLFFQHFTRKGAQKRFLRKMPEAMIKRDKCLRVCNFLYIKNEI
jgi:hypothetical protein